MENGAELGSLTFAGQDVLVVADKAITDYLEDLQRVSDKKGL
jgi:hypothetical protein